MMDRYQIIQIDATILVGLLILLTLSSLTSSGIISKGDELNNQISSLESDSAKHQVGITYLKNQIGNTNDTDIKKHLQAQLDDLNLQHVQELSELKTLQDLSSTLTQSNIFVAAKNLLTMKRFALFLLLTPFVISMAVETILEMYKKPVTKKYNEIGITSMFIGFLISPICIYIIILGT